MSEPAVETNIAITVPLAFTKSGVDTARRTVRGIMTQEVVDVHGEEVDFESVKACLASWRGNIREMHQPKAVGKAVDIKTLDDLKAVEVESYISKGAEDTWQKCLDGTLGFYSLGGVADRVMGRRSDGTNGPRLLMRKLNELSVVDSGACPTSSIAVVKMVDGVPTEQLTDVEPTVLLKGTGFKSQQWNIGTALGTLAMLESLITDQSFEDQYDGDNSPDNAGQIELLRLAAQIVIDFIATEFEQQFASDESLMKLADGDRAVVTSLIEKAGARHSRRDVEMLQGMHDNVVKLGAACGVAKMADETKTETATEQPVEPTVAAIDTPAATEPVVESTEKTADAPATDASEPVAKTIVTGAVDLSSIIAEAVTKAIDAVRESFTTQIEELKATSETTIAKLQDRVESLSGEPQPGGPVANAHASIVVEKGDGNVAELLNDKSVAERVITQLEEVAKSESDPETRQRLVERTMSLRMQHGIGAVIVPHASASR
jgi:hypothetical protein